MEKEEIGIQEDQGNGSHPLGEIEKKLLADVAADIDGMREGADSMSVQQKLGVLQRLVTAVQDDVEYRQVLLTAMFDNKAEAMLASDAITERKRYGVSIQPVVDRVIAQCAIDGKRVQAAIEGVNSFRLSGNMGRLPLWKKKQDGNIS